MLLNFGARNFFCFKEGIEISFELGSNCPKSISKGEKVSNLLCVKGANASGKTNALKVISFLKQFCTNSFALKPEEEFLIDSHFNNDEPIDIFCGFQIEETKYHYEVSLTSKEIISETLSRRKKRLTTIFRREGNKFKNCIGEFKDIQKIKLRSNASIISTAHQYESKSMETIYNFFNSVMTNVSWIGRYDLAGDYKNVSKYYEDWPKAFKFAKEIIKKCDLGIKNITIHTREDEEGKNIYFPIFEHEATIENSTLTFHSQSSGTQALYRILPYYWYVLTMGGILVLDEFDINFHPHMLHLLVDMFDDKELNENNAQMIFTTHNTDIMDNMSKYRTILVNQEESESYGYRLDEIPGDIIRNDRPLAPVYKSGKIGGIPKL